MRHLSVVALIALVSFPALAQKVVVLEIDGDDKGRLRTQIEKAVKEAGTVTLVPLAEYKAAASKRKMKGAAAMTPVGVARASRGVKFDAAVGGDVSGGKYNVLIYDRAGEQLWARSLAVKKGVLSADFAEKLARAIAAAAEQGAAKAQPAAGGDTEVTSDEPVVVANTGGEEAPGLDLTQVDASGNRGVITGGSTQQPEDRDADLDDPNKARQHGKVPVRMFRFWVGGATTWRSQCLRPGVASCAAYELTDPKPTGITIDFTASAPYLGVSLNLDFFPLALLNTNLPKGVNAIFQGIGVVGGFMYGQSQTRIVEQTAQGQGPDKTVNSDDISWNVQGTFRYHFEMGIGVDMFGAATNPKLELLRHYLQPVGWVGLRGGGMSRSFLIDPNAGVSLPSSDRAGFGVLGIDAALAIFPFLRLELAGSIYFNPRPGPDQIIGYGNLNDPTGGATASGFGLEAGLAGDIWGPIGYSVRWRMMSFTDRYYGQGQKWTVCNEQQCGGVGEESFHTLIWGLTASY